MVLQPLPCLLSVTFLLLCCAHHVTAKLSVGDASSVFQGNENHRERNVNENRRALDTPSEHVGAAASECPAAMCHFCVNPHKHTWAEHEYEALERGCNLATIKNEHNQLEVQGLVRDQDGGSMLYIGGIFVESIKTWTWVDGWPSMRFKNWMGRGEPTGEAEVGTQAFMALMVTKEDDSSAQWIPVDGDELIGAVYKCCKNDYNSGITVRH